MPFNTVQLEVLRRFRKLGIRSLVVGGQAMRAYGIDRITRDIDLWVARDERNVQALMRFTNTFPVPPAVDSLRQPNFKLTVGDPSLPDVDILMSVAGDTSFDEAFGRYLQIRLDGQAMDFVCLQDLLAIKKAAAAAQEADAADAGGRFNEAERLAARGTAQKERRDIMLLEIWARATG